MVEICNSRSVTVVLNPSDGSRLAVLSAGPSSRVSSWRENSGGPSRPSHAFAFRRQGRRAVVISYLTKYATPACVACRRRRFYFYLRATISRQSRFALPPDPSGARACANTHTHSHTHVCKRSYLGTEFLHCGLRQPLRFMRSRRVSSQQPINCCLVFATSL